MNSLAIPPSVMPRLDRRIVVAVVASIALHIAIVAMPLRPGTRPAETMQAAQTPLSVRIVQPESAPVKTPPIVEPVPVPAPRPVAKPRESRPEPLARPPPVAQAPPPLLEPVPVPAPTPRIAEPKVDMLAMIEARRAQRRNAEDVLRRKLEVPESGPADPGLESINRNLKTLTAGEAGVSGVFQIISKGTRSGEFAFNGWRPGSSQKWRQVIEVDAGPGGDVERAIVRRMIELIRTHYTGNFNWLSQRLGRTVVLSARPSDQEGLEEFLLREFFGTPTLKSQAPAQ